MGDRPHQALTSVDESKIQVSQKPKLVRNDTFDPAKARDLRDATTPKRGGGARQAAIARLAVERGEAAPRRSRRRRTTRR